MVTKKFALWRLDLNNKAYPKPHMKKRYCIEDIEKKVRKQIRLNRLVAKNDTLYVSDDGKLTNVAAYNLLSDIIKDPTIQIKKVKRIPKQDKKKKEVLANTLEIESAEYIEEFIKDKKREEKNTIKPLIRLTLEECRYYCNKKRLNYKDETIKDDPITEFIQAIQKKYESTMHSLIRSEETLKK